MATEYNHLIESNENFSRNPNYMNNFNTKKIYNNQNINMEVENNNKILEDDFNQNQNSPNQNMISSGFNPYLRPPQYNSQFERFIFIKFKFRKFNLL